MKPIKAGRAAAVLAMVAALVCIGGCHSTPLFAPTGATITLSSSTLTLPLNGTATITATVTENGGSAVQNGTTVTFATTLGSFSSTEATTNGGKAVVTFNAGTQSGTAVITAFSGAAGSSGSSTTGSSVSIVIGAAAASSVQVTASPASVSQLGTIPSTITATVVDANSNGVPGATVLFSSDQGALSTVTATTNANGQATTQLTTSQAATVTATVGAKSGSVKVSVYAAPTIAITPPTAPTALVAATFALTVTPGNGAAAITDVTVNFGDTGAGSIVDLGAVSGPINVSHAYANADQYTFTATVKDGSGQTVSASTPVTVYAAIPFTLTVSASTSTATVGITNVSFTATPNAGAPSISSYTWDFGDSNVLTTTVPTASHVYVKVPNGSSSQQVVINVTATGSDGRVGYGSVVITVNSGG